MPAWRRPRRGNRALSWRLLPERREEARRNYTAACKDYQENAWVGVSSTITESESPTEAAEAWPPLDHARGALHHHPVQPAPVVRVEIDGQRQLRVDPDVQNL